LSQSNDVESVVKIVVTIMEVPAALFLILHAFNYFLPHRNVCDI
jgi:hypothetical protein